MPDNNFDIVLINDLKDLEKHLSKISKDSTNNILYTNCISKFRLANVYFNNKFFNTLFYSLDSNTLIIFSKNNKYNNDDIRYYLKSNDIFYNEVSFNNKFDNDNFHVEDNIPNLVLANSEKTILEALNDTLKNSCSNKCSYYPIINGNLSFMYNIPKNMNRNYNFVIQHQHFKIENLKISGIITTVDKAILLVDSKDNRHLRDIVDILRKVEFDYYSYSYSKPKFIKDVDKYNKKSRVKKK